MSASAPSVSTPTQTSSIEKPTSDDWFQAAPKKFEQKVANSALVTQSQEDLALREAIRNLASILHPRELKRYAEIINPPRDAMASKVRHDLKEALNDE